MTTAKGFIAQYDHPFLNTYCAVLHKGSFTLRAEPIRLGKQTSYEMEAFTLQTNRAGPNLTERVHWLMFVFTRQPTTESVAQ